MKFHKIKQFLDQFSPYPVLYPFHMSDKEGELFERSIGNSSVYLEFGLGGSTLRALQKSKAQIYTVESNPVWITFMRRYLVFRYFENRRLSVFHVDLGPTQKWGFPKSQKYKKGFPAYSSQVFESIDGKTVEAVFIDGRFRVACTLKVILECYKNKNLRILIHDFWNREEYHIVLKYLDSVDRVETMGLFSIKQNVNVESVAANYETYKFNPD